MEAHPNPPIFGEWNMVFSTHPQSCRSSYVMNITVLKCHTWDATSMSLAVTWVVTGTGQDSLQYYFEPTCAHARWAVMRRLPSVCPSVTRK